MTKLSTLEILGGGPAGLYTAILVRKMMPHVDVRVTEQNPEGATFGFGVVFTDRALEFLQADDPETHDLIVPHMERWKDMTLDLNGQKIILDGLGLTSIGRLELIEILKERAIALDVPIRFKHTINSLDELDADLVVGADGVNSLVRRSFEDQFGLKMGRFENHFAWFGAQIPFNTLTQTFIETNKGSFNAHHYRYCSDKSTFIIECTEQTYQAYGFDQMDETESAAVCSEVFKDTLKGTQLITNRSMWRQFPRIWCENWITDRYALVGDAAHTAHFSIGSGTRLALEDSIALVTSLASHDDLTAGLAAYQESRVPIANKIVTGANRSATWYDSFDKKMDLAPLDFAYDYLTRAGMSPEKLRKIVPGFMAEYDRSR